MHFENRMFMNEKCNRLHKWAVPTIFPTLEGSSTSSLCNEGPLGKKRSLECQTEQLAHSKIFTDENLVNELNESLPGDPTKISTGKINFNYFGN